MNDSGDRYNNVLVGNVEVIFSRVVFHSITERKAEQEHISELQKKIEVTCNQTSLSPYIVYRVPPTHVNCAITNFCNVMTSSLHHRCRYWVPNLSPVREKLQRER